MKHILILAFMVMITGCANSRIEKDMSLTVKLRGQYSKNQGTLNNPIPLAECRPVKFTYGGWKYIDNKKSHAVGIKEKAKDGVDSIGRTITGQIATSFIEVVLKGAVELGASAIQAGFVYSGNDKVIIVISGGDRKIYHEVSEGFNRWPLLPEELAIFKGSWSISVYSDYKYQYAKDVSAIAPLIFTKLRHVEIVLNDDGSISINGSLASPSGD